MLSCKSQGSQSQNARSSSPSEDQHPRKISSRCHTAAINGWAKKGSGNATSSPAMITQQLDDDCSLFRMALDGDISDFGSLLESYRNYLSVLAESRLDRKLRGRVCAADIVQETMLQAHRDFHQFRGGSEREFLAWLRQILAHTLARTVEVHVMAKKRDVRRDVAIEGFRTGLDDSASRMGFALAANCSTPSSHARKRERAVILADVMSELPDAQREVLVLRNMQGMPFAEVAQTMGRSIGATKMLWMRAIKQLQKLYEHRDEG